MHKSIKIPSNMVQYNKEDDVNPEIFEALASPSLNPGVRWTKFILTDNKPNANNQRIPTSEFDNLIKTGRYMPLKMAEGAIKEGHDGAKPIGVITHLQKVKDQIIGLAALWERERQDDVDIVRLRYEKHEPLDLSWEIGYKDSKIDEDTGVESLLETSLNAVTLVGIPAYAGRTIITAFASEDESNEEELPLDEKDKKQLEDSLALANDKIKTLEDTVKAKELEASNLLTEVEQLREYKKVIEDAKERLSKAEAIKTKFSEAGIEKEDEYFTSNIDRLLEMGEEALDFMIQELVGFSKASAEKNSEASFNSSIPRFAGDELSKESIEDLIKYLKERNTKTNGGN